MTYLKRTHLKMSRKIFIVLLAFFIITSPVFANPDCENRVCEKPVCETLVFANDELLPGMLIPDFSFLAYFGVATEEENQIPEGLRNNEFFLESLRLTRLAMETFEYGDYDASAGFAEEAIRYAELSDEYVAFHLIAEARRLLDWADSNNIQTRFPNDYTESKTYYDISVIAHANEEWNSSIDASSKSIGILAVLEAGRTPAPSTTTTARQGTTLPRQYTVRTWAATRDCLWNIAGYSWVYGDPWQWRRLYEANRSRMPDPNNPNLIEPGFVLEIPSIRGETREGMWDPNSR